ncbi:hypothetical protein FSARC_14607 [Fusarium sarcochroum]|uniref:Uncharacterized protein n=1 Tax=Fusarium sarcochroum TaxID=1208366 RepID=A0A8H4SRX8_9HYPO|nr:hypothetical protein FSARC_14607 [Fusarium sarcochroum]
MGILNKFDVMSTTHANIEAHGILSDQIEKGLLWMPLGDTSLQKRNGFPSWSWAGWAGPVAYQIVHGDSPGTDWWFWPPAFSVKTSALVMKPLLDIHIGAQHRIIACLKDSSPPKTPETHPTDKVPSQLRNSGILNIYTYVAEVSSLTLETSFVVREHATSMNVPLLLARVNDEDECIAVVPDCRSHWTTTPPAGDNGKYRLAIIGKGRRKEQAGDDDNGGSSTNDECVVLLLERRGDYFERVGLSTVPAKRSTDLVEEWANLQEYKVLAEQKRAVIERPTISSGLSWISGLLKERTFSSVRDEALIDPAPAWNLQWISLA